MLTALDLPALVFPDPSGWDLVDQRWGRVHGAFKFRQSRIRSLTVMDSHQVGVNDPGPAAPRWYSRAALAEFDAVADAERARLDAVVAEASTRLNRSTASTGLNRAMVEMIVQSQREIQRIRLEAESAVAAILNQEDRSVAPVPEVPEVPESSEVPGARDPDPVGSAPSSPAWVAPDRPPVGDDYFARLKDSLGSREGLGSLDDD